MYYEDEYYDEWDDDDYEDYCGECGRHFNYCQCEPDWETYPPFAADNLNQIIDSLDTSDGIPF